MPKKKINIPDKVKSIAELISATIVIGTALIGAGQWMVHQINSSVNARVDALEQKIDDNQEENKLAITRLELMTLMQHDPNNIVEIEKLGRYYFQELSGDRWMSSVYSDWARQYGGDISIVVK